MATDQRDNNRQWRSANVCPKCRYVLDLEEIDLKAITTGIATCPRCEWSGYIDIQIVESDDDPTPPKTK